MNKSQKLKFWSKVDIRGIDDCWLWKAGTSEGGYGKVRIGGKLYGAHRIAWMLAFGRMPMPRYDVCHSCDNPGCVNPNHLEEATHQKNLKDAGKRGRIRNQWATLVYPQNGSTIRDVEG